MSDDEKVIRLADHRPVEFGTDPRGVIEGALHVMKEAEIGSAFVIMIGEDDKIYWGVSEDAEYYSIVGVLEVIKHRLVAVINDQDDEDDE